MIGHAQSSHVADDRFCPIIGCCAFAGLDGDSSDPTVTPQNAAWGHGIPFVFQWFDHEVTPVAPRNSKRLYGKHRAATALPLGRLHVSGSNIGKLGSLGSPLFATDHRFPPIMGPFQPAPHAGNADPERMLLRENFESKGRKVSTYDPFQH